MSIKKARSAKACFDSKYLLIKKNQIKKISNYFKFSVDQSSKGYDTP